MWSKIFCVVKSVRIGLIRSTALKRVYSDKRKWFPLSSIHVSSFTTASTMRSKVPFDPIVDIMFEDYMNKVKEKEGKKIENCKMLKQEPPVSVMDIDGKPVEPIDINPWADPEEMANLFGDGNFMQRKLLTCEGDQSNEPVKDIIKVVNEMRKAGDEQIEEAHLKEEEVVMNQNCDLKEEIKETKKEKTQSPIEGNPNELPTSK